jgi:hypothetical protein
MLERLVFSDATTGYMTRDCDIDSLEDIAYLDGEDDVENMIKHVTRPVGTFHVGTGSAAVTSPNNGIDVYIRAEANLKLCVYYLKHMEGVQRIPVVTYIDLTLVRSFREELQEDRGGTRDQ